MDRLNLQAQERYILGKKVKKLRNNGLLPAHVFGKGLETEHISVDAKYFLQTFTLAGETGLIDLKIDDKIKPVMVRGVQYHALTGDPLHIDFYQVNLKEKVTVPVPLVLIGEDPEKVHLGEAIVLQTLNEVEVKALPTDLVEKIEVDKSFLKEIDDAIIIGQLNYDKEKLTLLVDEEEIVVKLAPAVTAQMEKLMEEQAAEQAAKAAEAATEEGAPPVGGEVAEGAEGEVTVPAEGGEQPTEATKASKEEKPQE